jgi:hemolysin activation/secretion protein
VSRACVERPGAAFSLALTLCTAGLTAGPAPADAQDAPKAAPNLSDAVQPVQARGATGLVAAPGTCPFAGQGLSVTLTQVKVEGATVLRPGEVERAVADLLNRRRDLGVVCAVRDRVAKLFADKGYRLTRVDVAPQTIHNGELKLTATEGYIADIDAQRLKAMGPSAGLARAILQELVQSGPIETRKPAKWDELERAVLLARDIPGAQIGVRLHAAPDGPGALEVVASAADRRRFDLTTGMQDLGSRELGEVAGFTRLDANSFTPYADQSSLLLFSTTTGRQKVAENVESVALGVSGLRAETDITYASTQPAGQLAPLGLNGDFFDAKAALIYPFVRSETLDVHGRLGFEVVDQRNSLGALQGENGSIPLLFRDKLRVAAAQGDLHWRPRRLKALDVSANVEVRQGIQGLGSSQAGDPDLSRAIGKPDATVFREGAVARWTFGRLDTPASGLFGRPWIQLVGQDQYAPRPLLAYEEYQIGNYTIGRGFDPGAASGDRAYGGQVETGWPLNLKGLVVEPFAFLDAARVENIGGYNTTIASTGGGLRTTLPFNFRLEVYGANPMTAALPNTPRPGPRLLASLTRVFSFR